MNAPIGVLIGLYFASYIAFSGLTKLLSDPLVVLPTSVFAASLTWAAYLTLSRSPTGWGRSRWRDLRLDAGTVACAVGGAGILVSSTVAYSLRGVSIVLPLLLMKAGSLLLAPLMDVTARVLTPTAGVPVTGSLPRLPPVHDAPTVEFTRSAPTRRTALVLVLASLGVLCGAAAHARLDGTAASLCCALVYLLGYALKLRAIGGRRGDRTFFDSETTLTLALAGLACGVLWLLGGVGALSALGLGGTVAVAAGPSGVGHALVVHLNPVHPSHSPLALLAGVASQGCGVFGGLILMRGASATDRSRGLDTHARLMPLNRCTSLLAGVAATLCLVFWRLGWHGGLAALLSGTALSTGEAAGAALMLAALWVGTR